MTGLAGVVVEEVLYLLKEKAPQEYGWDLLSPSQIFVWIVERLQRPARAQEQVYGTWWRGRKIG